MSAKASQADDGRTEIEQAREELKERFPDAEQYNIWETTKTVSVSFGLDDLSEEGPVPMVNDFDAPEGFEFDAVSLHGDTRQMFVTFTPVEQ